MSDLRLNRQQLAQFISNPQAIRAFEKLFEDVRETLPVNVEDVQQTADTAQLQAGEALAALASVAHDLSMLLLAPFRDEQKAAEYTPTVDPGMPPDSYVATPDSGPTPDSYAPPSVEQIAQQVLDLLQVQVVEMTYTPPIGELGTLAAQNAAKVAITGGAIDGADVGQTTPGKGNFTLLSTPDDRNNYGLVAGRFSSGYGGAAINTRASCTFLSFQVAGTEVFRINKATQAVLIAGTTDDGTNKLQVSGGIKQSLATALIASGVAMNNGAGVGAGTLTNAPAAGNPTKWVPFNDNGTTRYIPTW